MVREVKRGRHTVANSIDDRGSGGAYHSYVVMANGGEDIFATVEFQKGPIQVNGVNGCTNEDLLVIVADRLECFQEGPFPCNENQTALAHIKSALMYLEKRTADRVGRGVEGLSEP